jgi:aconitase B
MLVMSRQAGGVKFAAVLKATMVGGRISAERTCLTISNASEVTLLLTAATDYNRKNPLEPLTRDLRARALEHHAVPDAVGR